MVGDTGSAAGAASPGDTDTDEQASAAVLAHHAELDQRLGQLVEAVLASGTAGGPTAHQAATGLVSFATTELLPHAAAEEGTLYRAASEHEQARLLVSAMLDEHRVLAELVEQVRSGTDPARVAGSARALQVLFGVHLSKENTLVLPLLVEDPHVSVADLLHGMHELLGAGS